MRWLALMFLCMACPGHAQRAGTPSQSIPASDEIMAAQSGQDPLKSFSMLLLALNTEAAFNNPFPGPLSYNGNRKLLGRTSHGYMSDKDVPDKVATKDDLSEYSQEVQDEIREFQQGLMVANVDMMFDGGDSGSGVVGDGNIDLEDQHNTAGDVREAKKLQLERQQLLEEIRKNPSARERSAKSNYWGRKSIGIKEEFIKKGVHYVRAQQLENWIAQRAEVERTLDGTDGIDRQGIPMEKNGAWSTQDYLASTSEKEDDPYRRTWPDPIDEDEWPPISAEGAEYMGTQYIQNGAVEFDVSSISNVYEPFRIFFLPGGTGRWDCDPLGGHITKQSTEHFTVQYYPSGTMGQIDEAIVVYESEERKMLWKVVAGTTLGKPKGWFKEEDDVWQNRVQKE